MQAETTPLLGAGESTWEGQTALLVKIAKSEDRATRRNRLLLGLGGAVVTVLSGYTGYRGVWIDSSWSGAEMAIGVFGSAIGITMMFMPTLTHCTWNPKAERDIYKLVQDQPRMRTFSRTLAAGEIGEVANLLAQTPGLKETDLSDLNIIKPDSVVGLSLLLALYHRTVNSTFSMKEDLLTPIKNVWTRLRQTIATEVPYKDATV